MKIIISEEQMDMAQSKMTELVNKYGLDDVAKMMSIEPYEILEKGLLETYQYSILIWDKPIKSLGNLRHVDGKLYLEDTSVKSLGKLESVTSSLIVKYSPLESLGELRTVGGDLRLIATDIEDFGKLEFVGGDLDIRATPLAGLQERKIRSMINVKGEIYKKL
jgi:hypothetical protein